MFRLKPFIKNIDIFGHPINLNFEKNDHFRTFPGGLLSMLIYIMILSMLATNFNKILNNDQDLINSYGRFKNLTENGKINFNETSIKFFHFLNSKHTNNFTIDDINRRIKIYY